MPQELLDFLRSFLTPDRLQRIDDVLALRTRYVTVVLEHVHQSQNASACLRNCEAFGVQDVHVIPEAGGFRVNRDVARGAAEWLTLHRYSEEPGDETDPSKRCLKSLKQKGYRVVAVSARQAEGSLLDYEPRGPTALVFGNEHEGISQRVVDEAEEIRSLPLFGFTESFNVSVALALSLAAILPRVRGERIPWQLSAGEKDELREKWIRQSLGHRLDTIEREYHRRVNS